MEWSHSFARLPCMSSSESCTQRASRDFQNFHNFHKVFSTCITCRARCKKRRALQPLDPNIPSKRRAKNPYTFEASYSSCYSTRITFGTIDTASSTRITSGNPYPRTHAPSYTTSNSGLPACRSMAVYTELSRCNG
jgi:hypothetical protein